MSKLISLQKAKRLRNGGCLSAYQYVLRFENGEFCESGMHSDGRMTFNRLSWLEVRAALKSGFFR